MIAPRVWDYIIIEMIGTIITRRCFAKLQAKKPTELALTIERINECRCLLNYPQEKYNHNSSLEQVMKVYIIERPTFISKNQSQFIDSWNRLEPLEM